jgi:hypothetical protein
LFPFYIKVLSFNLGLTYLIIATIFIALGVSGQKLSFHEIFSTCLLQFFIQLAAVTLFFSMAERHLTKHPDRWDLGGVRGGLRLDLKMTTNISLPLEGPQRISRFESVSIIIASAVALVWLTEVQSYPFLVLGPAATFLKLAPIWYQVYFPIVLLTVAEIVRAIINLARPDWIRFRAIVGVIVHSGGLAIVYFLIKAGSWVAAVDSAAEGFRHAVEIVNQVVYYCLWGTAALSAVMLIARVARLIRPPRRGAGSARVGEPAKEEN